MIKWHTAAFIFLNNGKSRTVYRLCDSQSLCHSLGKNGLTYPKILLAELQEILDAEAVGRPAVPVAVVGRPLVAVADHLLEAVARNVDHRTAVTQEGQPLVDHRLPDVTPQRQAAEAVFARGHQRHLIGLHLFAEGASLIFVSDDFDDLASDNSFLPDRIQRDYQLLSEFQTKQLRQPTHLFRGLQVR